MSVVISGTGLYTPPHVITNEELVESFNQYVDNFNTENQQQIEANQISPLQHSSAEFIQKASGIQARRVIDKAGILNIEQMYPNHAERPNNAPSIMCEISCEAAHQALIQANKSPAQIDAVIVACSNLQRAYPAIAIEVQAALGCSGFAYDLNVACSSATFGIQAAVNAVQTGQATCVLVINPEICTGQLNFRDRDSHFIFGDACTATVVEAQKSATSEQQFTIISSQLKTNFSNNIRNNAGFLNRCDPAHQQDIDKLFVQQGRKVFKEVVPMVADLITGHLESEKISPSDIKRFWLHQANLSMNQLITKRVLGFDPHPQQAPIILDKYANTSSAGVVIAFNQYSSDLQSGDLGLMCSFGAGYSAGSILLQKV